MWAVIVRTIFHIFWRPGLSGISSIRLSEPFPIKSRTTTITGITVFINDCQLVLCRMSSFLMQLFLLNLFINAMRDGNGTKEEFSKYWWLTRLQWNLEDQSPPLVDTEMIVATMQNEMLIRKNSSFINPNWLKCKFNVWD